LTDHLQVAASFVVTVIVKLVVPTGRIWFGVGAVILAVGGVVSVGGGIYESRLFSFTQPSIPDAKSTYQ
jgi:hypothetical protein